MSCLLHQTRDGVVLESVGKIMAPLMKPMLRRRMRVIDAELKEYAEAPN